MDRIVELRFRIDGDEHTLTGTFEAACRAYEAMLVGGLNPEDFTIVIGGQALTMDEAGQRLSAPVTEG